MRILLKLQMKAMIQRQNPNLQGEIHLTLISIGQIMTLKIRMMICLTLRKAIKRTKRNCSQNEGEDTMSQVMKIDNLPFKNAEIRKKLASSLPKRTAIIAKK